MKKESVGVYFARMILALTIIICIVVVGTVGYYIKYNSAIKNNNTYTEHIQGIKIEMDKKEYFQDDDIKIYVNNRTYQYIYFEDQCSGPCLKIQKKEGDNWVNVMPQPYYDSLASEKVSISYGLNPWMARITVWGPKTRNKFSGDGTYRFVFYYGFSKDFWDENVAYSDPFIIKAQNTIQVFELPDEIKNAKSASSEFANYFEKFLAINPGLKEGNIFKIGSIKFEEFIESAKLPQSGKNDPVWIFNKAKTKALSIFYYRDEFRALAIYNRIGNKKTEVVNFCWASCDDYWRVMWLDNDQFVLFETNDYIPTDTHDPHCVGDGYIQNKCNHALRLSFYDLKNYIRTDYDSVALNESLQYPFDLNWHRRTEKVCNKASFEGCWRKYDSTNIGIYPTEKFSLKYPQDWNYSEKRIAGYRNLGNYQVIFVDRNKKETATITSGVLMSDYLNNNLYKKEEEIKYGLQGYTFNRYSSNNDSSKIFYTFDTGENAISDKKIMEYNEVIVFNADRSYEELLKEILYNFEYKGNQAETNVHNVLMKEILWREEPQVRDKKEELQHYFIIQKIKSPYSEKVAVLFGQTKDKAAGVFIADQNKLINSQYFNFYSQFYLKDVEWMDDNVTSFNIMYKTVFSDSQDIDNYDGTDKLYKKEYLKAN